MILAFDSSSSQGSVALVENGATVREIPIATPRGRGGRLFTALEEILQGHPPLERVVVGTGPGSYNGIRAAISVGWGIAAARKIPLFGVSSLLGLSTGSYCAIGDARRSQFYFAVVESGRFLVGPVLLEAGELHERLAANTHPIYASDQLAAVPTAATRHASAALLAGSASTGPAEPIYLKPPFITAPSKLP